MAYNGWLDDYTGLRPSLHIVGLNGKGSGLGGTLASFQANDRRWARKANGYTGMIVVMAGSDPELASQAIFAAAQNTGYYFSCQVWWAAGKPNDGSNDDRPHSGRQAGLKLPGVLDRNDSRLILPSTILDQLDIGNMAGPSSANALFKMVKRSACEKQRQVPFVGPAIFAKVISRWQLLVTFNGRTAELA